MERNLVTDQQIADAFFDEWMAIEDLRKEVQVDLVGVCKAMHAVRVKLTEDMICVLVENQWKEGEVTKALAESVAALMRAIRGLERSKTIEEVVV